MNYLGRLKSWVKAKIASSEAHKYKMEIAVLSAIILLFVLSFSISASVRFFCKEHPGILIVVISVAGEIVCEWRTEKSFIERLKKFFGICLVAGLLLEIVEAVKSDKQVEIMRSENLTLQTNLVAMNGAVIQLSHQYDLSTNALAEANARLDDAESKLISVSNAAETNSPANFPITEATGSGSIFLNKKYAALIEKGRAVWLELYPQDFTIPGTAIPAGGAVISGEISGFAPSKNGDIEVGVYFNAEHVSTAGPVPPVTFKNVKYARLNLNISPTEAPLRVSSGWLFLNFSSQFRFDAVFSFEPQTNRFVGGPGIWAKRTER